MKRRFAVVTVVLEQDGSGPKPTISDVITHMSFLHAKMQFNGPLPYATGVVVSVQLIDEQVP